MLNLTEILQEPRWYWRTDLTKLIRHFCYYANAPNKWVMSTVKYAKWRRITHLLYNVTCLVTRSGETRSTQTPGTICFDCRPCSSAGEVTYRARREFVHFSTRNIKHITCLSLILQWASFFISSTCKNSHKWNETNIRIIYLLWRRHVCT